MPQVQFTPQLSRFITVPPPQQCPGNTVAQVLNHIFESNPELKGYIVDEQGTLRKHVAVFVDGQLMTDRSRMSDRISENADIFVMQALSGG